MLDILQYSDNGGTLQRTIVSKLVNLQEEADALQKQVDDFRAGEQTPEILDAINNYNMQIVFLQSKLPPKNKPIINNNPGPGG